MYGVRHYRPPPSGLLLAPMFPHRPPRQTGVEHRRRVLVARHASAYRPKGLTAPVAAASFRGGAHAGSVQLYDGRGFPGLVDNGFYPADAQVAVGPQQIVEMTNTTVGVYGSDGLRLAVFPMTQILGTGRNENLSDPQIAWDQESGRWLASAMDLSTSSTEVSVSNGPDPRGRLV